jgi:hypothetical protein
MNEGVERPDPRAQETEIRYPENRVVGLLETTDQLEAVVGELTAGGFLRSEIEVLHGAAAAEKLRANTGRTGLTDLAMRFAESIGIPNDETRIKNEYADGLGKGKLLVTILALTEERRGLASRALQEHGASNVRFFGRYTIEHPGRDD